MPRGAVLSGMALCLEATSVRLLYVCWWLRAPRCSLPVQGTWLAGWHCAPCGLILFDLTSLRLLSFRASGGPLQGSLRSRRVEP